MPLFRHLPSFLARTAATATLFAFAACTTERPTAPASSEARTTQTPSDGIALVNVSNVTRDTTAQNETPIAVNPLNPLNLIVGGNDWNYNDGCAVNASLDAGRSWTPTLPDGFLPGITKFTNNPAVAGTGPYDYGGDPAVAFGPTGTAYFACFGYEGTSPYGVKLLLSRSYDGGRTWLKGDAAQPLAVVSAFQGNGKERGGNGQFADHEQMAVSADGTIYVTWAQFHGTGGSDPVYVSTSRNDGVSFSAPVKVSAKNVNVNQNQRVVTNATGSVAFLVWDNFEHGSKGTAALYVSQSTDRGQSWSDAVQLGAYQQPIDLFPPSFSISGTPFRGPGTYPAPAYNAARNRLYVAYADIVNGRAQVFVTWASATDLSTWSTPVVVAPVASGDRFGAELSIAPNGRLDVMFYDRSYSANSQVDVTYATSADGGASWRSRRVTSSSFDPAAFGVPGRGSFIPFLGDYNGIASTPTNAYLAWTGPGKIYGIFPTNLEIWSATVKP